MNKIITIVVTAFLIAGCASGNIAATTERFSSVKTIQVKDGTDPLLLASTGAANVANYVAIGLRHLGYEVCDGCQADAVATVVVSEYDSKQDTSRPGGGWFAIVVNVAISKWTLTITRGGETIYRDNLSHKKKEPIDQLAARQARDTMANIPKRP